ncbi:MAG TPA: multicopper oxidase domain-containing protein [Gemmatimonadaceae bacterium]
MRLRAATLLAATFSLSDASFPRPVPPPPPVLLPNDNTKPAGTTRNNVVSIELDAVPATWHLQGGASSIKFTDAFAERGRTPTMPGPLVRVAAGATVHFNVRNRLTRPLTFFVPTSATTDDSIVVAPGATGDLTTRAAHPGNFFYRATDGTAASTKLRIAGALAGAFVVDTAGAGGRPRDRVMMMMMTPDSALTRAAEAVNPITAGQGVFAFTINGRSWPNTERIFATVGDTLRWRVINASWDVHPMHLHGFYFKVDQFDGLFAKRDGETTPAGPVVTQRLSNFSSMSMTWVAERPGDWLFHCHFALHLHPPEYNPHEIAGDHALTGMTGLVVGIIVKPRGSSQTVAQASVRKLRLIAVRDAGFPDSAPSMRFVIDEQGKRAEAGPRFSPTLNLNQNEPVAITVVNTLAEATSVHWHGMELESYNDGVGGWSGTPARLAPAIAPGDSFTARFTPPRAGTFMYHAHFDDTRQQPAGLVGPMIVRGANEPPREDDHAILINGTPESILLAGPIAVNGRVNADTIVFRSGRPQRLRFIGITLVNPNATVTLTARSDSVFRNSPADTMIVQWRPLAKDGADLPASATNPRRAQQIISIGETYDFEYTPIRPGNLRIEIRAAGPAGALLARVPVKVK